MNSGKQEGVLKAHEPTPTNKGKKLKSASMVKALKKPRDPEAEAMEKGGYSKAGGGIGSG